MHEVLVNRFGGLSLPRKSVVRLTDRPDMTLDVYRGRKTTIQHKLITSRQSGNLYQNTPKPKPSGENKGHNLLSQPICNYCNQSRQIVPIVLFEKENEKSKRVLNLQILTLQS